MRSCATQEVFYPPLLLHSQSNFISNICLNLVKCHFVIFSNTVRTITCFQYVKWLVINYYYEKTKVIFLENNSKHILAVLLVFNISIPMTEFTVLPFCCRRVHALLMTLQSQTQLDWTLILGTISYSLTTEEKVNSWL